MKRPQVSGLKYPAQEEVRGNTAWETSRMSNQQCHSLAMGIVVGSRSGGVYQFPPKKMSLKSLADLWLGEGWATCSMRNSVRKKRRRNPPNSRRKYEGIHQFREEKTKESTNIRQEHSLTISVRQKLSLTFLGGPVAPGIPGRRSMRTRR